MKVFLDMVGCRLNQAEIEGYANQFRAAGYSLTADPTSADLIVINTCTVTSAAASDSRQKIRQVSSGGAVQVIVTGCLATLDPQQIMGIPGVTQVISNLDKDGLVPAVLGTDLSAFMHTSIHRQPIPGARLRTRAFIKAQDGCDNHCTFCITTLARGSGRSQTIERVLADALSAQRGGTKEVVLTGVHLGSWGKDFIPPQHLTELVLAVLTETDLPRLRLSSIEPWDLDEEFFKLWADPRLCRHLHLPLQSGSATTLHRMARKTTPESFTRLLTSARSVIPDLAVTTDIMVGFPGESDREFNESLAFVQAMNFAGGHVFTYSERPGTAAARLAGSVPVRERKERSRRIRQALAESSVIYRERFIGRELPVLWESTQSYGPQGWELRGLTDNYLRITAYSQESISNRITVVKLLKLTKNGLLGKLKNQDKS